MELERPGVLSGLFFAYWENIINFIEEYTIVVNMVIIMVKQLRGYSGLKGFWYAGRICWWE